MKNKIYNFLVILILLVLAMLPIIGERIGDLDELWQYSFANNMYHGLIPYKDFNMITTPLFPWIASLFLRIISNQLIVMRIFDIILFTAILYVTYQIFCMLNVGKINSLCFTCILYSLFVGHILSVEYNYLVLLLALLSLYCELYHIKKYGIFNRKHHFWLGILMGLTVVAKHTIGIVLSIMFVCYKALFIKNKQDFDAFKKIVIARILGVILPSVVLLIYLLYHHALYDCISYCVLGITEFNNQVSYLKLFLNSNILIKIFSFIMPLFLTSFIVLLRYRKRSKCAPMLTILTYAITMLIGIFPIANDGHFAIYGFIGMMATMYGIYLMIKKIIKNEKIHKFMSAFIHFFFICFLGVYIVTGGISLAHVYQDNYVCKDELEHYNGIVFDEHFIKEVQSVNHWILQKEEEQKSVYILDSSAVTFRLPMNQYYKDFDMFNKGNFGKNGQERLIQQIAHSTNAIYLLLKDKYQPNWQTPLEIIDYVKNNKSKIDEIGVFDVYE